MKPLPSLLAGLALLAPVAQAADADALWKGGVQAMLDEQCVKCHGPLKQKSGLELDTVEGALKGGEDGAIIKPGKPDESPLLAALTAGADPHMPPKKQLTPAEIEQVRAWVAALGQGKAEAKKPEVPAETDPTAAIDRFLEEGWRARGVTPAAACDDLVFIRRVYLDLAGRIPKPEEVTAFLAEEGPAKRKALIDRVLASDDYPRNFREIWDALLMGRGNGRKEQRRKENGWFTFLETAFKRNRPWNEVVRAIIEARPEKPEDKGAFWFVYERKNEHQRIAEAIAPVIYGTQVACAQCHDHPLAREIKQGHYWGLVAAFNRSKNTEKGSPSVEESAAGGYINFTNLKKESQPAVLMMLTGRTVEESRPAGGSAPTDPPEGYVDPKAAVKVPKFSRRAALAEAATTENPLLARAFVNDTWAILMGRGIVHPVDEINSKHPASHPELLEWLARDFAAHGYDVRRLVRAIARSRGYALARAGDDAPAPEAFAAALEKPLTAEAIARSMQIASGRAEETPGLKQSLEEAFPDVLPRVPRATIQQAMLLANNEKLAGLFQAGPVDAGTPEEHVRAAFKRALVRAPDAEELAAGVQYLQARPEHSGEAMGQLLWALVTGPEFLTNH